MRLVENFLEDVKESGLVSAEEFEGIAHKNAERLLKIVEIDHDH